MINVGRVSMIPILSVKVAENRARQEFGDLSELEKSLKQSGLIQPLAVCETEDGKYQLLAGERRYTVLLANGVKEIPVRIYDKDISELEKKVIEKSENFYRKDMEYWELDSLISEIHEMEQGIYGKPSPGPTEGGHTMEDTANIFGVTKAYVSTAIKRAKAREAFPELFDKCKTQKDASKVLKKINEETIKDAIVKKIEREKDHQESRLTKLSNCYILEDFFEGVKKVPNNSIHLVEIDPPYSIDLHGKKRKQGESIYKEQDYNEIHSSKYRQFISKTFEECFRVMAEHSWLICWFAPEPWFNVIYKELLNAGFETTRMCGIWTKPKGQSNRPEIYLANSYEMFFYAYKGRPALNKPGRSNIFNFPPIPPQRKAHPTERPIELMKEIYDTFAFPGSRILIPFLGSGNGLIAADTLGMSALGFELSKSYRDSFLVKVHGMNS